MAEDSQEALIQRIIREGAIGFVRRGSSNSFYARFESIPGDDGVLVEITFNPEFVELGGPDPTDVVVCWGDLARVSAWLDEFLNGLEVEWSPRHLRRQLELILFGAEAKQMTRFDPDDPWDVADTGIPPHA
ncbi:hypothetical protein [Microbacterium sp. JAI119]|uniref:hypothetical protein n=1 Tax=Microbacterium TaxID=33882 RepID=UPI000DE4356D|nr:hypothetical protein [Microbacterium sp. JAI119]NYF30185.1 hypothetical protein [Microbacterium sp. JAI119]RBO71914.1 hypothetical protein DSP71_13850 [Microbacterium sp. H6]